jgi:hypothetical protein
MLGFRLITIIGVLGVLLAVPATRADQASLGEDTDVAQYVTAADVTDSDHSAAPAVEIGPYSRDSKDILMRPESDIPDVGSSEMMNILNESNGLELDADQVTEATMAAVPRRGKQASGIPDLLLPSVCLLLGTALTSFAFFTRRTHKHSRRAYFSRHFFIARHTSKSRPLRISPSAGSSEPSPSENNGHSLRRKRLA